MAAVSFIRGHKVISDSIIRKWFYIGTRKPSNIWRPCARCGKFPTKEGHDACLGILLGVKAACCGHGVEKGYVMLEISSRNNV